MNVVNLLFWLIIKPDSNADSIKTIITRYGSSTLSGRSCILKLHSYSMTAVITTTMTLRIILSVRGTLYDGGSFAGMWSNSSGTHTVSRGVASARVPANAPSVLQINSQTHPAHTYTLDGINQKVEQGWDGTEGKNDILPIAEPDQKNSSINETEFDRESAKDPGLPSHGVKITVDREIADYDPSHTK